VLDWLKVNLQYVTPKHLLSRLVGKLAEAEMGSVTTFFIKAFIKQYNVDMSEALHEEPEHYRSFNKFFTRPLKPEARTIDENDDVLIHAVDGTVSQFGDIHSDSIFQAKGHDFSLTTLLGGKPDVAAPFLKMVSLLPFTLPLVIITEFTCLLRARLLICCTCRANFFR